MCMYMYTQLYIVCVRNLLMRRRQMGTATHRECIYALHPHEVLMIRRVPIWSEFISRHFITRL